MILTVNNLEAGYKDFILRETKVLSNITLELKSNKIYGLIGSNGAGKTTFFKTILGLIPNYEGEIKFFGLDHKKRRTDWLKRVGYVPEEALLPNHLTAYRFLYIHGGLLFPSTDTLKKDINEKFSIVGLSDNRYDKIGTYSKGMKKRLMTAHALLGDPDLLILDEPFEGLDPRQRLNIKEIITALRNEGKTALISSHELYELQDICDFAALMEDGIITIFASMEKVDMLAHFRN